MSGRSVVSAVSLSLLVVFIFSISVDPMPAQSALQPEAPGPVHPAKDGEEWVAATLRSLSLEEKIGQMLMGRCFLYDTHGRDYKTLKNDLEKYHLGSFVVAAHVSEHGVEYPSPLEAAQVINQLQTDSKLPLLFAADLEQPRQSGDQRSVIRRKRLFCRHTGFSVHSRSARERAAGHS
ncbi:MAG TPA: hypothetical protein VFZ27_06700 [Terriglobia bacterium]|nr:hypothetical protein [Terriglobia bacterium]